MKYFVSYRFSRSMSRGFGNSSVEIKSRVTGIRAVDAMEKIIEERVKKSSGLRHKITILNWKPFEDESDNATT